MCYGFKVSGDCVYGILCFEGLVDVEWVFLFFICLFVWEVVGRCKGMKLCGIILCRFG